MDAFPSTSGQQERNEDRYREPRLTLRPPSQAAPYAPVQNWHHQPEKLIFESCGYEANVCAAEGPPLMLCSSSFLWIVPLCSSYVLSVCLSFLPLQYLGSMLIKELRGTESTQDACAKMRVRSSAIICVNVFMGRIGKGLNERGDDMSHGMEFNLGCCKACCTPLSLTVEPELCIKAKTSEN